MSFLRPEVARFLTKWREAVILVGISATIAVISLIGSLAPWFSGVLFVLAIVILIFAYVAIRRVLLRDEGLGVGYVEISEQKISFFGQDGSGAFDLEDLAAVDLSTDLRSGHQSEHYWILTPEGRTPLVIPGNAHGVEDLFSALTSLPGIDLSAAIRFRVSGELGVFKVWRRDNRDPLLPEHPLV